MTAVLLAPDEPPALIARNLDGASPLKLLCEHASNRLPPGYLQCHIAWDIGAASLARFLSAALDAPPFKTCYSRLVDCNRLPGVPASIPDRGEDTALLRNFAGGTEARRERPDPVRRVLDALLPLKERA
jgi:predicted N-formylglutamate amidohydrolase